MDTTPLCETQHPPTEPCEKNPVKTPETVTPNYKVHDTQYHAKVCGAKTSRRGKCLRTGFCPFHSPSGCNRVRFEDVIERTEPLKKRSWTHKEHQRFLQGLQVFPNTGRWDWRNIANYVGGGRTPQQVQSHAQKYFKRQKQTNKKKRSIHDIV